MIVKLHTRTLAGFAGSLLAITALIAQPQTASAQSRRQQQMDLPVDHGSLQGPPMLAVVSIKDQRISVYDAAGNAMRAKVSSGAGGYETPVGTYSILQKNKDHYSNVYDDAAMPFMQRITWSGVALHQGELPGYPASHGCVRLPMSFAEQLFPLTKIGMRVVISREDIAPVELRHPILLQPGPLRQTPIATRTAYQDTGLDDTGPKPFVPNLADWPERQAEFDDLKALADEKANAAERAKVPVDQLKEDVADRMKARGGLLKAERALDKAKRAADERVAAAEKALAAAKNPAVLKPLETAKAKAEAEVLKAADKVAKAALEVQTAANERLRAKAQRNLRMAERAKTLAVGRAARAGRELAAAQSPTRFKKQEDALAKLTASANAMTQRYNEAKAALVTADGEIEAVNKELAAKSTALELAQAAAKEAKRRTLPVSIFVSLKTQRVYVRQGHEPVLELPITISEPNRAIGTHIFTALDYENGANALRWNVVSIGRRAGKEVAQLSGQARRNDVGEPMPTDASAAAAALDRITLPKEAVAHLSGAIWPGSSLIVSDEPAHKETNNATDFIVLISGEPQGGIKRRPKPAPVREYYYSDDTYYSGSSYGTGYDRYGRRVRIQKPKSFFDSW